MTDWVICAECKGKGFRLKPYVAKAREERCPKCGGHGVRRVEVHEVRHD